MSKAFASIPMGPPTIRCHSSYKRIWSPEQLEMTVSYKKRSKKDVEHINLDYDRVNLSHS